MNNRFRPDAEIRTRAVLSLDDDLLLPCADVEAAFAAWRAEPRALVGWVPRLAEPPEGPRGRSAPRYRGEPAAVARGRYNLVLAGAAFLDAAPLFAAYSAPRLAAQRALVDELRNCDDLLMNFVAAEASAAAGGPAVRYLRASRSLDLSPASGVGISHDAPRFVAAADRCLADFKRAFGGVPLRAEKFDFDAAAGRPPPDCADAAALDCSYRA
jgi:hypothetical protein